MLFQKLMGATAGEQPAIIGYEVGTRSEFPSVNTPSGIVNGNLLVLTGAVSDNEWQNLSADVSSLGFTMQSTNFTASNPSIFVATRVVDGSEAVSYSLDSDEETALLALIALNLTFDTAGAFLKSAGALSLDIPEITVANENSYLFTIGGIGSSAALTIVSGTELFNVSGNAPALGVHYEVVSSGATGSRTITRPTTNGGIGGVLFAAY